MHGYLIIADSRLLERWPCFLPFPSKFCRVLILCFALIYCQLKWSIFFPLVNSLSWVNSCCLNRWFGFCWFFFLYVFLISLVFSGMSQYSISFSIFIKTTQQTSWGTLVYVKTFKVNGEQSHLQSVGSEIRGWKRDGEKFSPQWSQGK